jgi:hypothetical protein
MTSYACDKMPTARTVETCRICAAHFSRPATKIKIILIMNYLQHNVVCIYNQIFNRSFIFKDYISMEVPSQIFVSPPARVRQPISHSQCSDIHIHLIYPMHNTSLLSWIFASVRLLNIIMSYDHSKFVTELNESDRSKIRERRNVNISICLFIHRSPWRTLSRRVAHHPERRPRSLLFLALRPIHLVKCKQPTLRKPMRPSCAAKRPQYVLWTTARGRRQRRGLSAT